MYGGLNVLPAAQVITHGSAAYLALDVRARKTRAGHIRNSNIIRSSVTSEMFVRSTCVYRQRYSFSCEIQHTISCTLIQCMVQVLELADQDNPWRHDYADRKAAKAVEPRV